ncbi:hypothetical protein BPAE_0003g01610 [Botrytis paeoniae]|uniref:Uncharacterized protein n=1 Tax=Botrytis paeoniae TaxID=278948 RepID=A0A4Z1G225_9HELO|nr:hypothetical protein BPAE_0003g01610 [Botrytis paeoniae]
MATASWSYAMDAVSPHRSRMSDATAISWMIHILTQYSQLKKSLSETLRDANNLERDVQPNIFEKDNVDISNKMAAKSLNTDDAVNSPIFHPADAESFARAGHLKPAHGVIFETEFLDFVLEEYVPEVNISDDREASLEQMEHWGLAGELINCIMASEFEDLRTIETVQYWVRDTMSVRYLGLKGLQKNSARRDEKRRSGAYDEG